CRPGAAPCVKNPVDLPLGEEAGVCAPRVGPVREFGQTTQPDSQLGPLVDRPLEALLTDRHVEAGLAERVRQRAERVPVQGLRRHEAAVRVDVLPAGDSPELLPQLAQAPEELLLRRETARNEPGGALGPVPGAEPLDHGLRMDGRQLVARKLAHRRRSPQALRAGAELVDDLLVRVALADASLKSCERLPVDPLNGSVRASTCHGNQNRAYSPRSNKILLSL